VHFGEGCGAPFGRDRVHEDSLGRNLAPTLHLSPFSPLFSPFAVAAKPRSPGQRLREEGRGASHNPRRGRREEKSAARCAANRWRIFVEITVEGARFSEKCHHSASRHHRRDCKANKAGKGRQEPPREISGRYHALVAAHEQSATATYRRKLVRDYFQVSSSIYRPFIAIRRAKGIKEGVQRGSHSRECSLYPRHLYVASHRIAAYYDDVTKHHCNTTQCWNS